jgi:hypothetical protein
MSGRVTYRRFPDSARSNAATVRRSGLQRLGALAVAALLVASSVGAQLRGRRDGFLSRGATFATAGDFDGGFQFCRVVFRTSSDGDGNGWNVDWPRADQNLSIRLSELTRTSVSLDGAGQAKHLLVSLTDPLLSHCPFVMMTEPGGASFDEQEAASLRNYLLKGGFLWADDFWGSYAFDFWAGQLAKVLPPSAYPILDLPLSHPLFHTVRTLTRIPQIPGIRYWLGSGGRTSERGADSAVPHVRAIADDRGRIMVLMTHNSDFGDAFEEEATNHDYFLRFSVDGYAFGVNAIVYAMTH